MQCVAMAVLSVLAVFEIIVAVIAELLRTDEVRAEPQTHALARLLLLLLWGRRRNYIQRQNFGARLTFIQRYFLQNRILERPALLCCLST